MRLRQARQSASFPSWATRGFSDRESGRGGYSATFLGTSNRDQLRASALTRGHCFRLTGETRRGIFVDRVGF